MPFTMLNKDIQQHSKFIYYPDFSNIFILTLLFYFPFYTLINFRFIKLKDDLDTFFSP